MHHSTFSKLSPVFIALNIILSSVLVIFIKQYGEEINAQDTLDIVIEFSKTFIHFLLFCSCAMLSMEYRFKAFLLIGLFFTQVGMGLDTLDEFYEFHNAGWHLWGDLVYLIGLIFVSFGVVQWGIAAYKASIKDKLTGVYNRRYFDSLLEHYVTKVKRQASQVCLVCIDLDNFKKINDTHGHAVGDKVLVSVAKSLTHFAREIDVICRTGGEEFEILMPGTTGPQAEKAAKRILSNISANTPPSISTITASIGVTNISETDVVNSVRKRADDAMYVAKNSGKNQVVFFDEKGERQSPKKKLNVSHSMHEA